MKSQSSLPLIMFSCLIMILFVASQSTQNTFDKITVREFEMVDQNGKRRASIKVEEDGELVFRMMDDTGTIRVKMSAGEDGSAFLLLDQNTNPGIHALAKKKGTTFAVIGQDGKKREY